MVGVKLHASLPPENSPSNSSLIVPYAPVRLMFGKKAARAAPILALAARS